MTYMRAASADGRRAQDPIGISISPSAGQDVRGPYAALDSVLAVDQTTIPGSCSCIMELNPEHILSDADSTTRSAQIGTEASTESPPLDRLDMDKLPRSQKPGDRRA